MLRFGGEGVWCADLRFLPNRAPVLCRRAKTPKQRRANLARAALLHRHDGTRACEGGGPVVRTAALRCLHSRSSSPAPHKQWSKQLERSRTSLRTPVLPSQVQYKRTSWYGWTYLLRWQGSLLPHTLPYMVISCTIAAVTRTKVLDEALGWSLTDAFGDDSYAIQLFGIVFGCEPRPHVRPWLRTRWPK